MSTPKQIRTNDLTAGKEVLVTGKVVYSHVASHISGPALDKANQDALSRGRPTHNRPYTTITICDAQVVLKVGQQPNQMTTEQLYVQERLFESKSAGYTNKCYQAESKSPNLPGISVYDPSRNVFDPINTLEGELARGLQVTLVMKVFDAKPNKGFGLDSIICNEPIRYFGRTPMAPTLAEYGFNLTGEMMSRQPGQAPVEEMPASNNVYPDAGPMPAPGAPAPVPPPAPGTDPYATQPAAYPTQNPPAGYPQQTPPAGYPQQGQAAAGYPNNAYGQQPPAAAPAPATYPTQPGTDPAAAPAGYPNNPYGQQPPAAGAYTPPAAAPAPATYPPQQGTDPAQAGYAGPFTPTQPAAYPGSNDGIAYNPANDPGRQY